MSKVSRQNEDMVLNIDTFKKSINNMIAVSERSYNGKYAFSKGEKFAYFHKDEVLRLLAEGDPNELREISKFFFYVSGYYKRLISYYATILKGIYLTIPHFKSSQNSMKDSKYLKKYNSALSFIDRLDLPQLSSQIAARVLVEGAFYGVLRQFEDGSTAVQVLPARWCRSRFVNQDNVAVVEMSTLYFDHIYDKTIRDEVLKSFPKTIRDGYWAYKNRGGNYWVAIKPGDGLYFKLMDERPYFCSIIPAIIDFNEYREIEKAKDMQELKELLIQKLPIEDGELVFDTEEAEEIHRGSVEMLADNKYIDVLTTFADVSLENMESKNSVVTNNLEKISNSIYTEAGVSKEIFAADGNMALTHSITNDASLMQLLYNDIANWIEFVINEKFSDNQLSFKMTALPISYYNQDNYLEKSLSLANSGYSFLIPAMTMGLRQSDLTDLKSLEVDGLNLKELMTPLTTSYTQSAKSKDDNDDGSSVTDPQSEIVANNPATDPSKVNLKPETEKSDKTIQNINSQ